VPPLWVESGHSGLAALLSALRPWLSFDRTAARFESGRGRLTGWATDSRPSQPVVHSPLACCYGSP